MLSGIPQVAQIGPSLVAKNGTPFCLFTQVPIRNEHLIDALLDIGSEERSILLLYYSLGLKDPEISKLLHTSRSRVQRLRSQIFSALQKKMR